MQDMDQKTADERVGGKGHDLLAVGAAAAIILAAEDDAGLVVGDEEAVRDRYPECVTRHVGEHRLRPGEWRLA